MAPVLRELAGPARRSTGTPTRLPVKPKYYPTDWDLSAARAVTVLRHLNERRGIADRPADRGRRSATTSPLVDPATPGSQQLNKRVDIVVLSDPAPRRTPSSSTACSTTRRPRRDRPRREGPLMSVTDDARRRHDGDRGARGRPKGGGKKKLILILVAAPRRSAARRTGSSSSRSRSRSRRARRGRRARADPDQPRGRPLPARSGSRCS